MIDFRKHSGIYTLEMKQKLNTSLTEAWDFFSLPGNLAKITPPYMGFNMTSTPSEKMYEGQIITFTVGILPFIRSNWITEITRVSEPCHFIDEQRIGPYKMWHHEHIFESIKNGVLMTDRVSFAMPFGILGHLAYQLLVKKQLEKIFIYRFHALENFFNHA